MNPDSCKNVIFNFICGEPIKLDGLITLFIAFVTLMVAFITWHTQNKNQKANNLLYVNESISSARKEFDDLCITKLTTLNIDETGYLFIYNTKMEGIVYAYDLACKFYFDKTVDQQNFKNTRRLEINQIIENEPFKLLLKDKDRSEYQNLWKAYTKFKC